MSIWSKLFFRDSNNDNLEDTPTKKTTDKKTSEVKDEKLNTPIKPIITIDLNDDSYDFEQKKQNLKKDYLSDDKKKKSAIDSFIKPKISPLTKSKNTAVSNSQPVINLGGSSSSEPVKTCRELRAKDTNYIFTFGYTGSGKSTVLTALALYLRIKYGSITHNSGNSREGARLVQTMIKQLKKGAFPKASQLDVAIEYDIEIPDASEDDSLYFTFIEMAGESLKSIDVSNLNEIPPAIDVYLKCPDIDITFLLVADYKKIVGIHPPKDDEDQDSLIYDFLSLLYNRRIEMSKVALILAKFDFDEETDKSVEWTVKKYMYETFAFISKNRIDFPKVFPFTIGKVDETAKSDEPGAITTIELGDCDPIVQWITTQFAENANTKASLWKKIFGFN